MPYKEPVIIIEHSRAGAIYRLNLIHDPFPPHSKRIVMEVQDESGLRIEELDPMVSELILMMFISKLTEE